MYCTLWRWIRHPTIVSGDKCHKNLLILFSTAKKRLKSHNAKTKASSALKRLCRRGVWEDTEWIFRWGLDNEKVCTWATILKSLEQVQHSRLFIQPRRYGKWDSSTVSPWVLTRLEILDLISGNARIYPRRAWPTSTRYQIRPTWLQFKSNSRLMTRKCVTTINSSILPSTGPDRLFYWLFHSKNRKKLSC